METTANFGVWQGSLNTLSHVAEQIKERFGEDAVAIYDPLVNCFTYKRWLEMGYQVRKGEKALKSITWVKGTREKDGQVTGFKFPRTVNLFFVSQVDQINKTTSDETENG